jgi:hypothetical protein
VEQREGGSHGVQVRIDAMQGQLRRVLVESDLVSAVVRRDKDLEVTP